MIIPTTIGAAARFGLLAADPSDKVKAARRVARAWRSGSLAHEFDPPMPDAPTRPAKPELLPASRMPRRGRGGSQRGRVALLHALAHIEYGAIVLTLIWRLAGA